MPNGLFWTMEIPSSSFQVRRDGQWARLRVDNLPVPNTFFYSNNVSVASEIDVDITWKATSDPIVRGKGGSVPADSPEAYVGEMRDATCRGTAKARQTGFSMRTGRLTEDGFIAMMGHSRNGVFLP